MSAALYAEFRKLLSVRSTYIISAIGLLITGFIAFWATGYRGGPVFGPESIQSTVYNDISVVAIFTGIVAVLLICHEYRYTTINYTLAASNSRLKVFLAKFIVVGASAAVMTLFSIAWIVGLVLLGAHLAGNAFPDQVIDVFSILWKTLAYMIGGAWFGLILGFLSRNIVFAVVAYFLIPVIEQILHGLMHVSTNYMPNAAQGQILQTTATPAPGIFSPAASAGVFGAYLLGLGIVALILFVRKDAN